MCRIRILKVIVVALGVCLCIAWFGATIAADHQPSTTGEAAADEGLVLIKSDMESVIVELHTPSYEVKETNVDGAVYHLLAVAGYGQTGDVGRPQLPLKGTLLGIPPAAEFSLNVLEVEEEIVPERYNIYPVPRPVSEWDAESDISYMHLEFAKDESVYSSNTFCPGKIAEVGSSAFVRDQRVVELRFFPFHYNPVTRELRQHRRIRVELRFNYPRGQAALLGAREEDESFSEVLRNSLLNYDSASNWRARSSSTFSGPMALKQSGPSYKVLLDQDGTYQLTGTDLQNAGIAIGDVDPLTFKLHNQGDEVAIYVVDKDDEGDLDPDDYILFYGQRMTSRYTNTNVYWLTWGGLNGLRMPERDGTPVGGTTVLTYFQTTARWEEDKYYQPIMPRPATVPSEEEMDHWFGGYIVLGPGVPPPHSESYTIMLDNLTPSSPPYSSTVRGYLHGLGDLEADPDRHTRVYLNGHLIDDAYWDGQVEHQFYTNTLSSYLVEGSNVISVELPNDLDLGGGYEEVYTNWFEIDYRRTYTVENDSLYFDGDEAGTWEYQVGDFLTDAVEVFDVTDSLSVTRIVSTSIMGSGTYSLTFKDTIGSEHHYLAVTPAQYQDPLEIVEDVSPPIQDTFDGADYIIITHPDFYSAVLPLRDHRIAQGLDTIVVDVGDVYDDFSYGIFDPQAIRDFLIYAYANWNSGYVLLVGDGTYDFKDNVGSGEPNYVPPYLVYADEWVGETAADNRYACVSGGDILADMYIGRLPAQTSAQASAMVGKIVNYEENPPQGDWQRQVLFVADNADAGGDFPALSNDIADNHLPPAPFYTADKVYYLEDPYMTPAAVKSAIINSFGSGRLFMNYVGHGHFLGWGEGFLGVGDIGSLPESQKNPIMLPMTCMDGYFIKPGLPCMGGSLVRAQGKGAVASWSPTSLGLSERHHYLHWGLYDAIFEDGVYQIGPATFQGKLNLYQNLGPDQRELIDTYMLFGDPATRLPTEYHVAFLPSALKGY